MVKDPGALPPVDGNRRDVRVQSRSERYLSCLGGPRQELAELGRELRDGQHIFLLSPRRFGKTSLIFAVLDDLRRRGLLVAYVDVFRATTPVQLFELLASATLRAAESKPERLFRLATELLGRIRPQVGTGPTGHATLSFDVGPEPRNRLALQEEVLELPERLAAKRRRRLVLVFDEFQEIQRLPGGGLEKALRSYFQTHRHVSYLFAGSKESALREMATRERSPFYKFGRLMSLGPIPIKEFAPDLEGHFRRGRLRVSREILEAIPAAADDVPYLGSHSSVQTSLRRLLKDQGLVKANGEYRIADPLFRERIGTRSA